MSKNENKELNAILAQLKKSYSNDGDIEESASVESDDDFQKMLSSYFSDDSTKDIYKFTAADGANKEAQAQTSEYSLADFEEFAIEAEPDINETEAVEAAKSEIEPIEDNIPDVEIVIEKPEVETLGKSEIEPEVEAEAEFEIKPEIESVTEVNIDEYTDNDSATDDSIAIETACEFRELESEIYEIADDKAIVDDVFATMFQTKSQSIDTPISDSELDFTCESVELVEPIEAYTEPDEQVTESVDVRADCMPNIPDVQMETVDDIFADMNMADDEVVLDVSALIEDIPVPNDVAENTDALDKTEQARKYLSDPLQGHLSDAAYVSYKIADDEVNFDVDKDTPELDEEEISLLLDFGYDDEAEAEVGYIRASEIKRKGSMEALSAENSRIFGYCGEEYCDRAQTGKIKEKYARDKKEIFIKTALVLSIAVVMFLMSLINCFSANVNFILFTFFEMILLLIVSAITFNSLIGGFTSLVKLEPNYYSASALVLSVTLIYDIFEIIYIAFTSNVMLQGTLLPCGFISVLFVFAPLLSELFECISEAETFDVITSADKLYTAQKFNKSGDTVRSAGAFNLSVAFIGDNIFEIKKTSEPNGYFGRMSKKKHRLAYMVYLIGAIFALALIVGCVALIKVNSIAVAAYSSMTVILMGMPISVTLFSAIPRLVSTRFLKEKKCAMLSDASLEEYSAAETVIFDDDEALELVKRLEIRPEGDSDVAASIKIAARALKALGGPIAAAIPSGLSDGGDNAPEISITSIKDNGVELYMDSSIYMLIGDSAFMSAFGIKVSSDYNTSASMDASKKHSVIYIAIDGVPRLGYVISSKIRDDFTSLMRTLDVNGIKTAVTSYDPSINDYYFEQNKVSGISAINVYKPDYFYDRQADTVADGGIFAADDAKNIVYPLLEVRKLRAQIKNNRLINILLSVAGCLIAALFTILVLMNDTARVFTFATLMLIFVFQIISVLPPILTSFDFKKRQESETKK